MCVCVYQLGQAPLGEDPARAGQVEVSGDPAPHVEPLHGASRGGSVLTVQQHQLFLGSHRAALQHALQLRARAGQRQTRHTGGQAQTNFCFLFLKVRVLSVKKA